MSKSRSLTVVVASLVLLAAAVGPAAAAPWSPTPDGVSQVTYGATATPSWHVQVDDGSLDSLESWANSSDDRSVIRTHNGSNYALVSATEGGVGKSFLAGILNSGLQGKAYVTSVTPNYQHSLAEPVRLENASGVPAPGRVTRTLASAGSFGSDAAWSRDGIAYDADANVSTVGEARDVLGVDNVSATGAGATVAVIDSGVNADERVFGNGSVGSDSRILNASKDIITGETVEEDGLDAVADPNGHGTFVASQIAANTSVSTYDGVAPDADILALRALDESGSGSTGDIAAAVRYAADNDADVIVMSLGSPVYDEQLELALKYAVDHNVSAIAIAAGNSRQTTRWLASPADAPVDGVTAVSATNTRPNGSASTAYFANAGGDPGTTDLSGGQTAGQQVDVSAPGMKVEAKVPTQSGSLQTKQLSGTSMAAPYVAGIAALGVSTNEPWTGDAAAFNDRVRATARTIPNAATVEVGQGMAAADHLLANETSGSQATAMDSSAKQRQAFWEGWGDWQSLPGVSQLSGLF